LILLQIKEQIIVFRDSLSRRLTDILFYLLLSFELNILIILRIMIEDHEKKAKMVIYQIFFSKRRRRMQDVFKGDNSQVSQSFFCLATAYLYAGLTKNDQGKILQ